MLKKWGLFIGVGVVIGAILLMLPRQVSRYLFWGIMVAPLGIWSGRSILGPLKKLLFLTLRGFQSFYTFLKRHTQKTSLLLLGSIFLLLIRQAKVFDDWQFGDTRWIGLIGLGVAYGLLGLLLWLRPAPFPTPIPQISPTRPLRWWLLGIATILIVLLAETNARIWIFEQGIAPRWQLLGFLVSLGLLSQVIPLRPSLPISTKNHYAVLGWIAAITLLGLLLRLWRLDSSIRLFVDEILFVEGADKFRYSPNEPLFNFIGGSAPFSQLYTYAIWGSVQLVGQTFFGLRLVSVILGALTVPAVYGVGRYLFDHLTGLAAAILLVSFPLHLHFSRLGLNQVGDPLFGTIALASIAYGLQSGQRRAYWLGGIALGLTQYFYEGGRLVFPGLIAVWLGLGAVLWKPRLPIQTLLWVFLPAILVAFPWYYTIYHTQATITPHFEQAGSEGMSFSRLSDPDQREIYWGHLELAIGSYVTYLDASRYYMDAEAMILPQLLPLFLLGVGVVAIGWRNPPFVLVIWLVGVSIGNSFIRENDYYTRFLNTAPALVLLLAVGMRYPVELLIPKAYHSKAMLLMAAIIMVGHGYYYFEVHLPYFNTQARYTADTTDAVIRSLELPRDTLVYIVGDPNANYHYSMSTFLAENHPPMTYMLSDGQLTLTYIQFLDPYLRHAFFIQPDDWRSKQLLASQFDLTPAQYSLNPYVTRDKSYILYVAEPQFRP